MKRALPSIVLLAGLAIHICSAAAPELAGNSASSPAESAANLALRIERVALFKNGLGYVTATATLPQESKTIRLGPLPVPTYGTFWVQYDKNVELRSLTTAMETVEEPAPVAGLDELLRLNPGRKVVLHLAGTGVGPQEVISGAVQPLLSAPQAAEPPSPYFMDFRRSHERANYYGYPPAPATRVLMIKTERGVVALSPGSVQRVEFEGEPVCVTTNREKRPSIRVELQRPAGGKTIAVSYLARGITWAPSYLIDLSDDKTARFSAQAQIINEVADLDNVRVELVTGFPNIQFPELPNPVAMSQTLAEFLRALAAGRAEGGERGYMMQQQALVMNSPSYSSAPLPAYSTSANAEVAEDLFLYPLPNVSLNRNETATIPLFTTQMPYRHCYTWNVADQLDSSPPVPSRRGQSAAPVAAEEVWHVCRLVNAAKMPLTTAAAEFVKDGQFVGQDTCFYTAPGAETSIRINRAMNVLADQAEVELERKRNAENFYGWSYDLVKLAGELKVRNQLERAIDLEITKVLSGEVLSKSGNPTDVQTASGLKQVNPKHRLTWTLNLPAGEETKVAYSYQLYVRP